MILLHKVIETGVIRYNSLACIEFLQDYLGLKNITQTLNSIGI